jgi:hypothetical protein
MQAPKGPPLGLFKFLRASRTASLMNPEALPLAGPVPAALSLLVLRIPFKSFLSRPL